MGLLRRVPRIEKPDRTLEIFNAVVFAVTLMGGGISTLVDVPAVLIVVAGVVLFFLYAWVAYSRSRNVYEFVERSPKFVEFFSKWYDRPGEYIIFCDDLDWMNGNRAATIRAALIERASDVRIALRKHRGEAFELLKEAGVEILMVDEALTTHAKFSVRVHDGFSQMILRIEPRDNDDRVRFQSTADRFFIEMARDLINNNCSQVSAAAAP